MRLSMAPTMKNLTVTLKIPRLFRFRIWLGCWIIRVGCVVVGCGVKVDTMDDDAPSEQESAA